MHNQNSSEYEYWCYTQSISSAVYNKCTSKIMSSKSEKN